MPAPELISPRTLTPYQQVWLRVGRTYGTWRVLSRLVGHSATVRCFDGLPFFLNLRDPVGIQVLLKGFDEQDERNQILGRLPPDSIILDVGANHGVWARWLAYCYPQSTIYSFEPSAETCSFLRLNTEGFPNIYAIQAGCGDVAGDSYLSAEPATGLRHIASHGEPVSIVRLDDFCSTLRRMDFIKIDVEGMELAVLSGARTTLEKMRPVLLFEYAESTSGRYKINFSDLFEFLSEFDYCVERIPKTNNYLAYVVP